MRPQLAVFVIVSFALFMMVRPFTTRYLHRKKTDTNVDSFTGRKAVVKERINNEAGTGLRHTGRRDLACQVGRGGRGI